MSGPASSLSPEEQALLHRLQQGNQDAYRQLFDQYYPVLTSFALQYMRDEAEAKELVQEVFVALFQKRATLSITQSIKAYLFTAVYRTCLNEIKRQQRQHRHQQRASEELPTADYTDVLVEAENLQKIHQAIESLPQQCRRIFTMNRFEGLSNQAIADQLNVSKRTVETQISKALRTLRKLILLVILLIF